MMLNAPSNLSKLELLCEEKWTKMQISGRHGVQNLTSYMEAVEL